MQLQVDSSDLLKWSRFFKEVPRFTKPAIARALNTFGQGVVDRIARNVADQNGMDPDAVRQRIVVNEAEADNLEWNMDASAVLPSNDTYNRPLDQRDSSAFDQDTLVNLITSEDGSVCPVCEAAAEASPYTMAQLRDMQSRWADYVPPTPNIAPGVITNLVHPRCRCVAQPWTSYRRLPVSGFAPEGSGGNVGSTPPQMYTMEQLAKAVLPEILHDIQGLKILVR